jgi:hypothetical protein
MKPGVERPGWHDRQCSLSRQMMPMARQNRYAAAAEGLAQGRDRGG